MRSPTRLMFLFGICFVAFAAGRALAGPTISRYPLPRAGSHPTGIAAGPDGSLWFTEFRGNRIGRISLAGVITEFPLPRVDSQPYRIALGPDGALWFTERSDRIGRITVSGVITEFPLRYPGSQPSGITAGPDGALWFTEGYGYAIGRITTAGVITEFPIPVRTEGEDIVAGSDGALWFREVSGRVGRITTDGLVTEFGPGFSFLSYDENTPSGIAVGADGAIWFSERGGIGRIGDDGNVREFTLPGSGTVSSIFPGPDGALWFTQFESFGLGRITTDGVVTRFDFPVGYDNEIAAGPDGALWFTDPGGNSIGRIEFEKRPCVWDPTTLCLNGGRFKVQAQWTTRDGRSAAAQAVPITADTGYFTFFDPNSVELLVKVLDGCGVNQHAWTFAGGLTNVRVVMTVTDTATGAVKTYANPQGTPFEAIEDTAAFPCSAASAAPATMPGRLNTAALQRPPSIIPSLEPGLSPCIASATALCLNGSRFRVQADWFTPDGATGQGQTIPLTPDTGAFWFFSPDNVEMAVKVLDGCGVNSRHWTFAAGLTNVGVVFTVTDTLTGAVRTYSNPPGVPFAPIQDTDSFRVCP